MKMTQTLIDELEKLAGKFEAAAKSGDVEIEESEKIASEYASAGSAYIDGLVKSIGI